MVLLSSNRIAWEYTSDRNITYRVAAQKALTDQAKLGGQAWAGVVGPRPHTIKMRRITLSDGTYSRVVPVYSTDATILTAGTTLNVNAQGDARSLTSDGIVIAEKDINPRVTKEAA